MHVPARELRQEYLRHDKKFPHVWCPGCGNGIVMGSLLRAISKLKLSKDEVVMASGIGCSGRMPTYLDFNTLHTTHGRALTFATGIKLANPSLTVMAIMGDGDATAIGGNHFIHAARQPESHRRDYQQFGLWHDRRAVFSDDPFWRTDDNFRLWPCRACLFHCRIGGHCRGIVCGPLDGLSRRPDGQTA